MMIHLKLVFEKDLNLFIKRKYNNYNEIDYCLDRKASIKDIIESIGIPHTEIGKIIVKSQGVDFDFIPTSSMQINVLPIIPSFKVTKPSFLRPHPLPKIKFIVDVNVAKLSSLLRMLGIDTLYSQILTDKQIADKAEADKRIVLTKDIGLLKHSKIVFGRYIRKIYPDDQLKEVLDFFDLKESFNIFSICLLCNTKLVNVEKETIMHKLEPKTKKYFSKFKMCPVCNKIYWKGSHMEKMEQRLYSCGVKL